MADFDFKAWASRAPAPSGKDDSHDLELYKNIATLTGKPVQEIAAQSGMKTGKNYSLPRAAISSGTDALQGLGYSAGGAIADMANRAGVPGADRARDYLNKQAELNNVEAEINGRPEYQRVEDQSLGTLPAWALYQALAQTPQIAALIGATAVVPQATVPAWAARLGVAAPRVLGGAGLEAGASFAARRAALEQGNKFGAEVLGGLGFGAGMGLGSMYQESVEAGDPSPFRAAAMAIPYGLTETIPGLVTKNLLTKGGDFSGGMLARMAKAGGTAGVAGAIGETGQNEMEMSFNPNLSEQEKFSRRLNAAAAGGVAEAGFGSFGGIRRPISSTEPTNLLGGDTSSSALPPPPLGDDRQLSFQFPYSPNSPSSPQQDFGFAINPLDVGPPIPPNWTPPPPPAPPPAPPGSQPPPPRQPTDQLGFGFAVNPLDVGPPAPPAPPPNQPSNPLPASVGSIADTAADTSAAQAQSKAAQELGTTRLFEKFKDEGTIQKYEADGVPKWLFGGKSFSSESAAKKQFDNYVNKEAIKSDFQNAAEIKLLEARAKAANAYKDPPSPQYIETRFGNMFGGVNTTEELVARINARIETNKKSPKPDERFIEVLSNWKTLLEGGTLNVAPPGETAVSSDTGEKRGRGRPKSEETLRQEAKAASLVAPGEKLTPEEYQARLDAESGVSTSNGAANTEAAEQPAAPANVPPDRQLKMNPGNTGQRTIHFESPYHKYIYLIGVKLHRAGQASKSTDDQSRAQLGKEGLSGAQGVAKQLGITLDEAARLARNYRESVIKLAGTSEPLSTVVAPSPFTKEEAPAATEEAVTPTAPATEQAPVEPAIETAVAPTEPVTPVRRFRRAPATQQSAPATQQSAPATETAVAEKPVEEPPKNAREVLQRQLLETAFGAQNAQILSLYLNDPGMTPEMLGQGTGQSVEEVNKVLDSVNGASPEVVRDLNAAAQKLGLQRRQIAELLAPNEQTENQKEIANDTSQTAVDESELEGSNLFSEDGQSRQANYGADADEDSQSFEQAGSFDPEELFDAEEGGRQQTMGTIKSAGGSQSNTDAQVATYRTLKKKVDGWVGKITKAEEKGDQAAIAKLEGQIKDAQGTYYNAILRDLENINTELGFLATQSQSADAATSEKLSIKIEKLETEKEELEDAIPEAEKLASKSASEQLAKSVAQNNKPRLSSSTAVATVAAPNATSAKKRTRKPAKPENAPAQKLDPQREISGETSETRARRMWNEQTPPGAPSHDDLPAAAKQEWAVAVRNGHGDRSDMQTIGAKAAKGAYGPTHTETTQIEDQSDDPNVIDDPSLITEKKEQKLLTRKVEALPEAQQEMLEQHYEAKRDSSEFFQKLRADVVAYATKGATAVDAAIRHIIKNIHAAVIAAMMIFNPLQTHNAEAVVVSSSQQLEQQIGEQPAEVPADAASRMSPAAQEAYRTLYPAMKADLQARNKFLIIADKPNARVFVFNPDGSLLLDKKTLYGAAVGDYLKGNNNLPSNRITPAGLFNLGLREGGKTAGEYDFKKVFVLDKAGGDYSVTIMHSVWMKEKDAKQRASALKSESAGDSRYSFGCINVDRNTFESLLNGHQQQMDGAKIFIVPDNQAQLKDFLSGETKGDDLVREKVAQAPITRFKKDRSITVNIEGLGKTTFTRATLEQLSEDEGFQDALRSLNNLGLGHTLDAVKDWLVTEDLGPGVLGSYTTAITGRPTVILSFAAFKNPETLATTLLHEVGHTVDLASGTAEYSDQVEFRIKMKGGVPVALPGGTVAAELIAHHKEGDSDFAKMLKYPLEEGITDLSELREELFAQLWAYSLTPGGMDFLQTFLPASAEFIERTHAEVQATTYEKQSDQTGKNNANGQVGNTTRFSRQVEGVQPAAKTGTVQKGLDLMPEPVRVTGENIFDAGKKAAFFSMFTEDLANLAAKFMPSVKEYVKASRRMFDTRAQILTKIDDVVSRYDKLPPRIQKSVNELIKDMTTSGQWGFDPDWTQIEQVDLMLRNRMKALPDNAQAVVIDVFRNGHEMLEQKKRVVENVISAEIKERLAKAKSPEEIRQIDETRAQFLNRFNKLMNIKDGAPYAPLKRFGDYVVVAKSEDFIGATNDNDEEAVNSMIQNEKHYVVSFYETYGEAKAAADKLKKTGNYDGGSVSHFQKDKGAETLYNSNEIHLAFGSIRNLLRESALSSTGEDNKILSAAERAIADLYIRTLSEASARRSELSRQNVAGADDNMMRAFFTQGQADAHFLGSLGHRDEILESLSAMRGEARNSNDRSAANRYLNEFLARYSDSLDYKPTRLQDAVKRTTSLWMLAFSPAYYLQQVAQPFVLSLPVMGGQFGYSTASSALTRAYSDLSQMFRGVGIADRLNFDNAPAGVRQLLKDMIAAGKIDIGIDFDNGRFDSQNNTIRRVDRFISGANAKVEAINRAATAVAAYRLYLQKHGADKTEEATAYAERIIHQTHGSYDGFNNPRLTGNWAGGWGKVLTQFKKFQIVQLSLLASLFKNSFANINPSDREGLQTRAAARKALTYTLMHTAALGGAMGLPGATLFMTLVGALFGDDDEPFDPEDELLKNWGKAVTRGIPASLGVDVSGKFGMGNVLSVIPYLDADLSRSGAEKAIVGALGPFIGGLLPKMADGLGQIKDGDYYKGLEQILPNGVGNALKGFRVATEGVTKRNGDTVVSPEDVSLADATLQAFGLPTTNLTDRSRIQRRLVEAEKFFNERTADLKKDYREASKEKDAERMKKVRESFNRLQEARVRNGFERQPISSLLNQRQKEVIGGVQVNRGNRGFVQKEVEALQ